MTSQDFDDPSLPGSIFAASLDVASATDIDEALAHFTDHAARLTGARYAALAVLDDAGTTIGSFVTHGLSQEEIDRIGHPPSGRGLIGLLLRESRPLRLDDISEHPASVGFPPNHPSMKSFLGVPVRAHDRVFGTLYLTEKEGAFRFSDEDERIVTLLASAAAIAIENVLLREQLTRLAVADERERIAVQLHDTVIQRLFAIGLTLQSIRAGIADAEHQERLDDTIDSLDQTVREVRTAIFSLGTPPKARQSLRAEVLRATSKVAGRLGFEPHVRFVGPIDTHVDPETGDALIASLEELLDNVARHAGATSVEVEVALQEGNLSLEVLDDGTGLPPTGPKRPGSGIRSLVAMARSMGGSCVVKNAPDGGTVAVWEVPAVEATK